MREITLRPLAEGGTIIRQIYRYAWRNNSRRAELFGRACVVLARGALNSCQVEFLDTGEREIISRNALRRW